MSIYPAPTRYPSIFNSAVFSSYDSNTSLSTSDANSIYAKLAGGQTIVAQETFTGGVKTASLTTPSGELSITGNVSATGNLTVTGNITQSTGYSTSLRTTTVNGTLQATRIATTSTTQDSSVAGNLSLSGNVSFNTPLMRGSTWATAATTHTITSTQLPYLGQNNWCGELKLFADDSSSNSGFSVVYLHKPSTTLFLTQGTKSTSMTTFTANVASNTSVLVTLSNSCRLSWLFTGAT